MWVTTCDVTAILKYQQTERSKCLIAHMPWQGTDLHELQKQLTLGLLALVTSHIAVCLTHIALGRLHHALSMLLGLHAAQSTPQSCVESEGSSSLTWHKTFGAFGLFGAS